MRTITARTQCVARDVFGATRRAQDDVLIDRIELGAELVEKYKEMVRRRALVSFCARRVTLCAPRVQDYNKRFIRYMYPDGACNRSLGSVDVWRNNAHG